MQLRSDNHSARRWTRRDAKKPLSCTVNVIQTLVPVDSYLTISSCAGVFQNPAHWAVITVASEAIEMLRGGGQPDQVVLEYTRISYEELCSWSITHARRRLVCIRSLESLMSPFDGARISYI